MMLMVMDLMMNSLLQRLHILPRTLETFLGTTTEWQGKNNAKPRNFKRNELTKLNNTDKSKEKVGQTSNNSMGQQCFGCQGYGHVKSKCLTYLRSKGKAIATTHSDDEISNHESGNDEDRNFITFTVTAVIDESVMVEDNPFDGELFECADLQEYLNKL